MTSRERLDDWLVESGRVLTGDPSVSVDAVRSMPDTEENRAASQMSYLGWSVETGWSWFYANRYGWPTNGPEAIREAYEKFVRRQDDPDTDWPEAFLYVGEDVELDHDEVFMVDAMLRGGRQYRLIVAVMVPNGGAVVPDPDPLHRGEAG